MESPHSTSTVYVHGFGTDDSYNEHGDSYGYGYIGTRKKTVLSFFILIPIAWIMDCVDTKAKCRHLNKIAVKGLCGRCLSEFIDIQYGHMDIQSVILVFSTQLCELLPL